MGWDLLLVGHSDKVLTVVLKKWSNTRTDFFFKHFGLKWPFFGDELRRSCRQEEFPVFVQTWPASSALTICASSLIGSAMGVPQSPW